MAVSTAIVVRLRECHVNVSELFSEIAKEKSAGPRALATSALDTIHMARPEPSDAAFTESLLALGKVGLRVPGGSPAPVSAEASSLVSVHHAQSKSHGLVL